MSNMLTDNNKVVSMNDFEQMEKSIENVLVYVGTLPEKHQNYVTKYALDGIIYKKTTRQTSDEMFEVGISVDLQSSQIDKMIAPKNEYYQYMEKIPYNKPLKWNGEIAESIKKRIVIGNEAAGKLRNGNVQDFSKQNLAELAELVSDGKSAAWVYVYANLGLAVEETRKFNQSSNAGISYNYDLMQDAAIMLYEATQKYDVNRGCSLSTFGKMVIKRRMPRYAKKYLTSFHVSEKMMQDFYTQHCQQKYQPSENLEDDFSWEEKTTEFEKITAVDSLEVDKKKIYRSYNEIFRYSQTGNIAKKGDNEVFNEWVKEIAWRTLREDGYSPECIQMYQDVVLYGVEREVYADKFAVTERTIRNRIAKMSKTIRSAIMRDHPEIYELAGYEPMPEAIADTVDIKDAMPFANAQKPEGNDLLKIQKVRQTSGLADNLPMAI